MPFGAIGSTGFRLSLFRGMGNTRGNAESGFIRGVDESVDRFHDHVVVHLDRRPSSSSSSSSRTRETVTAG